MDSLINNLPNSNYFLRASCLCGPGQDMSAMTYFMHLSEYLLRSDIRQIVLLQLKLMQTAEKIKLRDRLSHSIPVAVFCMSYCIWGK